MMERTYQVKSSRNIKWPDDRGRASCIDIFIAERRRSWLIFQHRLPIDPAAHGEIVMIRSAIDDSQLFSLDQVDRRLAETANLESYRGRTKRDQRGVGLSKCPHQNRSTPEANGPGERCFKPGE